MAWSRVQAVAATSTASNTSLACPAFSANVTAGNRIIVFAGNYPATGTVDAATAPTDNQGNTYTKLVAGTVTAGAVLSTTIWTAVVASTGSLTVTAHCSANSEMGVSAIEYSGLDGSAGSGCLDVSAAGAGNANNTSNAPTGTTAATTAANQLAVCAVSDWGTSATWTLSTANGFSKIAAASVDADPNCSLAVAEKNSANAATESATWTNGAVADADVACVCVIKLAAAAAAAPVPPPPPPAEIILRQYGLDAIFQPAQRVEEINPAAGTGTLTFGASATGYTSAYSVAPQVDVAQLILDQFGFGAAFQQPPRVEEINVVAGSGSLTFGSSATGYTSAYVTPPPVTAADLILRQYGLEAAWQTVPPAEEINPVATAGQLTFGASATGYTTAYAAPPQVTPAQLILDQYGLDGVLYAPPVPQATAQFVASGTGNLDFEASATFGASAYSVPPPIDVAQLILDQFGFSDVFQVTPTQEINPAAGTGTLIFAASATGVASAYSVPPQIDVAQVILDQYGLGSAFQPPPPVEEINSLVATGQLTFNGAATAAYWAPSPGPLTVPAEVILAQYGLDSAFQPPPRTQEINAAAGVGNLDFEASANVGATALSVSPVVDTAQLILHQYGLDSAFQTPPPVEEINVVSGTGSLAFNATATAQTSLVFPVQVTPAELILQQYGLDGALFVPPLTQIGAQFAVTGTGNLDFEAAATGVASAYSVPPPVDVAQLILDQYGLGSAFQVSPVEEINPVTGTGSLTFGASATGYTSAYAVPAQVTPADLILQQYGLDSVLFTPPVGLPVPQFGASGTGNLDFEASSTFGVTAYATPALADIAQLILHQHGLAAAFTPPPPVGENNRVTATGNLDFEAASTVGASAYNIPPSVGVAQLILQQYGLEQALQVVQGSQALYVAAGGGNLNLDGSGTAGFVAPLFLPAQVTPAEIILAQYGLDSVFQQPVLLGAGTGVPSGLAGLVAPSQPAGLSAPTFTGGQTAGLTSPSQPAGMTSPSENAGLVAPTEPQGVG